MRGSCLQRVAKPIGFYVRAAGLPVTDDDLLDTRPAQAKGRRDFLRRFPSLEMPDDGLHCLAGLFSQATSPSRGLQSWIHYAS